MARRKKSGKKASSQASSQAAGNNDVYGMDESQRRLRKEGFHPGVTSKTPREIELAWRARIVTHRPTREQFLGLGLDEGYMPPRYMTAGMLLLRYESRWARSVEEPDDKTNMLATIFNSIDIGGEVAICLFEQGWKSVFNAASSSSSSWRAIANSIKIWDFYASDLRTDGHSGVLLAVTPECTIGELSLASHLDPYGLDPTNTLSTWCQDAMKYEREIYLSIYLIHNRIHGKTGKGKKSQNKQHGQKILPVDFMAQQIVAAVSDIRGIRGIWGFNPFVSNSPSQLFQPSIIFSAMRLRAMLRHISEQKRALKVLYFEKIPLLDRRMVAVILRECPNVHMIGIYDCPLIHFGDVLCLIDLIYEVNYKRRKAGLPEITAFDFYPRFNHGTPFQTGRSATYGLTWGPHKLDVVQRGFFYIILKAFVKAKRINLGLLFDKDMAFCNYLRQVPYYPLAVPMFLDALYRYVDARDRQSQKKALYDLVKPVRLGLILDMDRDWQRRYMDTLGDYLVFCSSCGYETLEEFYSGPARDMPPHLRVCAGCVLQRWLDDEDDHLKKYKKQILDTLYPSWKGSDFNKDAPIPNFAKGIIHLHSTRSVRPDTNHLYVDSDGVMCMRQAMRDMVRDNKIHYDSLVDLPTLGSIVADSKLWGRVYNNCNNLDVYCRAIRCLTEQEAKQRTGKKPAQRVDGGKPDTVEELQPPTQILEGNIPSHEFDSASLFHWGLTQKGWGAEERKVEEPRDDQVKPDGFW